MSGKRLVGLALGLFALALLMPMTAAAENMETPAWLAADEAQPSEETSVVESQENDAALTIEEAEALFGAHKVCGAPCGWIGSPKCRISCGDAAACFHHQCIYL